MSKVICGLIAVYVYTTVILFVDGVMRVGLCPSVNCVNDIALDELEGKWNLVAQLSIFQQRFCHSKVFSPSGNDDVLNATFITEKPSGFVIKNQARVTKLPDGHLQLEKKGIFGKKRICITIKNEQCFYTYDCLGTILILEYGNVYCKANQDKGNYSELVEEIREKIDDIGLHTEFLKEIDRSKCH